jgi:hypothetical protein
MTSTIISNAEVTGEQPVVTVSKPSPAPRETTSDLVARVAELEAQTQLSVEWAVVFSAGDVHDYQSEENARSVHRSLELPPENLLCRHVRRGPWTAVTS